MKTMTFIDIASHQKGLRIGALTGVDAVVIKATEGVGYVNPYCDSWVTECKTLGKPFGFYHFAANKSPEDEAQFFIDNTKGYTRQGIPILDWETWYDKNGNPVDWSVDEVNRFVRYYHDKTGIWPWIYANPWRFDQGGVEPNCGRWVAKYPNVSHPRFYDVDPANKPSTDGLVCAWQYCSDGRVDGWSKDLDCDYFYGDAIAWNRYANPSMAQPEPEPETPASDVEVLENDKYKVTVERK